MTTLETVAPELTFVEESRIVRATPQQAFAAWTEPELLKVWFGPAGRYCPEARLDARVGGSYFIQVSPEPGSYGDGPAPRGASAEGTYTRVVPGELLEFTWRASFNPDEENLVTVNFKPVDGGTRITIRHERVSEQAAQGYTKGWSGSLDKLAQHFAG